jgi:hypothetical protein
MITGGLKMLFEKKTEAKEVVIYNFDIKTQKMTLLFRGETVPPVLTQYQRLWRVKDKQRNIETVIIAI